MVPSRAVSWVRVRCPMTGVAICVSLWIVVPYEHSISTTAGKPWSPLHHVSLRDRACPTTLEAKLKIGVSTSAVSATLAGKA